MDTPSRGAAWRPPSKACIGTKVHRSANYVPKALCAVLLGLERFDQIKYAVLERDGQITVVAQPQTAQNQGA
jgi:hypothetical protein